MKYSIQYIGKNGDQNNIIFVFEEPYALVGVFLWAESHALQDYANLIDDVLQGKRESDEADANAFNVKIGKETSTIEDLVANADDAPPTCTVNTAELKKVILEYIQKRNEFFALKKKEEG